MSSYRIGIDLGGTNIAAGIVDDDNRLLIKRSVKTALPRPAEAICRSMADLCLRLCHDYGILFEEIRSIGIGSPGIIAGGVVSRADNLGFREVPLADMLAKLTHKPVSLKNDGNAAALGEWIAGSGNGCHSLIALTLGTGVGGGIILNGKILEGFNGAAGEVGHIVVKAGGRPCVCGNRGCLEAYCSATALKNMTKEAMLAHPESALHTLAPTWEEVNGKTAFDGMRLGDPTATAVVEEYVHVLANGIASLIQLFQPEIVCLGGGISREGETLMAPLREAVYAITYPGARNARPQLVTARLGNDAGIVGAAVEPN